MQTPTLALLGRGATRTGSRWSATISAWVRHRLRRGELHAAAVMDHHTRDPSVVPVQDCPLKLRNGGQFENMEVPIITLTKRTYPNLNRSREVACPSRPSQRRTSKHRLKRTLVTGIGVKTPTPKENWYQRTRRTAVLRHRYQNHIIDLLCILGALNIITIINILNIACHINIVIHG